MSTDLNQMTDAELSECFAVEVAGWRFHKGDEKETWVVLHDDWWIPSHKRDSRGPVGMFRNPHPFAESADLVMPWLADYTAETSEQYGGEPHVFRFYSPASPEDKWTCEIVWLHHDGDISEGSFTAATLQRAACCALIAARRAAKEATP